MYDAGQKTCLNMIEDGYVHTFEEILNLMNTNKKVREEAEHGLDKTMPRDFRKEPEILQYIEENLKHAEDASRKGSFEDNYQSRMKLGKYFQELEGYHWLAVYFYKSSQICASDKSVDVKLSISSMQQQALLEEDRGNTDIALKYLVKALRLAKKNSSDVEDTVRKLLNENLCRVYQKLGIEYLEKESDEISAKRSICLKFFKKATKLAMMSDDLENKATCQALLGKAMLKFNNDESALECFELYTELSEKSNDKHGMCQGYFATSEVFKRSGDLDRSVRALNKCQELAKEYHFHSAFIFSSISLGQIETAKRQYFKAHEHFEEAYKTINASNKDFSNKKELIKVAKVMYGIGKAHLSFNRLVATLQSPANLSLPKLLGWRNTGGPFKGEIAVTQDHLIDLEEVEKEDEQAQISAFIEKLIKHELNQE